jgi:glycosyltransferase involved in cell wall biosynthesis
LYPLKHIVYVTPLYFDPKSYLGGGERYPLNLARAVVMAGHHRVTLVSYGDEEHARESTIDAGISLRVLPATNSPHGGDSLSWGIVDVIRSADIVHIHQVFTRSGEVAMLASKLLGKPVCATDHGGTSSTLGRSLGILDLADRVTCYSRFGESLVRGCSTRIEIVPGGVDDNFFRPPPEEVARDYVLYVGRLLPHKGVDRLLIALPHDTQLIVCGQPYDPHYYAYLRSLASGKQVEFLVNQDDVALRALYQRAIAVVLPSVHVDCYGHAHAWPELMGYSLLEGMACGTPAVCSRVGGMPEYVSHGTTGLIFDELADLTLALETLAHNPKYATKLGTTARETVERHYGLAPAGAAMRAIYDELTETPSL